MGGNDVVLGLNEEGVAGVRVVDGRMVVVMPGTLLVSGLGVKVVDGACVVVDGTYVVVGARVSITVDNVAVFNGM